MFLQMRTSIANFANVAISRAEMKSVVGGTCHAMDSSGSLYGADKATVKAIAKQHGTHWCCDSCSTASWMQQWCEGGKCK